MQASSAIFLGLVSVDPARRDIEEAPPSLKAPSGVDVIPSIESVTGVAGFLGVETMTARADAPLRAVPKNDVA